MKEKANTVVVVVVVVIVDVGVIKRIFLVVICLCFIGNKPTLLIFCFF